MRDLRHQIELNLYPNVAIIRNQCLNTKFPVIPQITRIPWYLIEFSCRYAAGRVDLTRTRMHPARLASRFKRGFKLTDVHYSRRYLPARRAARGTTLATAIRARELLLPSVVSEELRPVRNWLSSLLGKLYRKHHRTSAPFSRPEQKETRLFNILRTVFSLQWLPCLFPPPFNSSSLSLFSSLLVFHSFVSLSPFLSIQLLSFDVRKLASVHVFCDFTAALNNRGFSFFSHCRI